MAERVAAGLRPDAETVRARCRPGSSRAACRCGSRSRRRRRCSGPRARAPCRPPRRRPCRGCRRRGCATSSTTLPRPEADHRDRALAAVRRVEEASQSRLGIEAVRARAGAEEAVTLKRAPVDLPEPVRASCRRRRRPGRRARASRPAACRPSRRGASSTPTTFSRAQVDLDELPRELAARDQVAPVGGEVHVVDPGAGHRAREWCSAKVCASRKSRRCSRSATTIA